MKQMNSPLRHERFWLNKSFNEDITHLLKEHRRSTFSISIIIFRDILPASASAFRSSTRKPLIRFDYTLKFSTWIPQVAWRCLRRSSQVVEQMTEDRGSTEWGRQARLHSLALPLVNYSQAASSCVLTVHFQMVLLPNTRSLGLIKKLK